MEMAVVVLILVVMTIGGLWKTVRTAAGMLNSSLERGAKAANSETEALFLLHQNNLAKRYAASDIDVEVITKAKENQEALKGLNF